MGGAELWGQSSPHSRTFPMVAASTCTRQEESLDPDPASGCRLMYPLDVGGGDSGTLPGVGLGVSLLLLLRVGEELGNSGGELVWQGRVVGWAGEELRLFWVGVVELGIGVGLWGEGVVCAAVVAAGAEGE